MYGPNIGFNGNYRADTEMYLTPSPAPYNQKYNHPYPSGPQSAPAPANPLSKPNTGGYKTRMCRHFELGKCKLSGLCNFAHGQEELNFYTSNSGSKQQQQTPYALPQGGKVPLNNSLNKIFQLEKSIEDFEVQQRSIISKLKHLIHNSNGSPDLVRNTVK